MLCLGIIKKRRERMVLCRVPYFMFRCAGEQHGSRTGGVLRPPEDGIPRWSQRLLQTWPACPWKSQIVFFFICCVWVTSFEHWLTPLFVHSAWLLWALFRFRLHNVDWCSCFLFCLSLSTVHKLQHMHNSIACLVLRKTKLTASLFFIQFFTGF